MQCGTFRQNSLTTCSAVTLLGQHQNRYLLYGMQNTIPAISRRFLGNI